MKDSIAFDRIAETYDETRGGVGRGAATAGRLRPFLPADGPLLEVGVGTGLIGAGLTDLGLHPVGVDLSLPMLAKARDRMPGRITAGDALRLPVRDDAVAAVCFVHVLHLVADVAGTLAEADRVLRPGGTLVASVFPGRAARGDVFDVMDDLMDELQADEHLRVDVPYVTGLAARLGFQVVGRTDEPGYPVTPANTIKVLVDRSSSWTWEIDDEVWDRATAPALARLRALPDPDRVRPGPGAAVLAFRK